MAWDWQVFCKDTIDGEVVASCFGKGGDRTYLDWMLSAWGWTLSVALCALVVALLVGSLMGILRTTPNKWFVALGNAWTELFRNIPLLVQIFLWYHVIPGLFTSLREVPPFLLVVFALARQVQNRVAGLGFDRRKERRDGLARVGGHDEPQVELVRALVVVRHLGMRVHQRRDALELGLRHAHGAQREGAAHLLHVEHRPEARERALGEHALERGDERRLVGAERGRGLGEGARRERKAALQPVDDLALDLTHSGRRAG